MIKRVRPPSASEDISGDASIVPIIARVRAEVGSGGGKLRLPTDLGRGVRRHDGHGESFYAIWYRVKGRELYAKAQT